MFILAGITWAVFLVIAGLPLYYVLRAGTNLTPFGEFLLIIPILVVFFAPIAVVCNFL